MFDELEIFTDKLFKTNLSLFYYFVLKFTENYPYETRHKCFSYDENKNLVTFIPKSKEEKHKCICPFMQVMIKEIQIKILHHFLIYFFKHTKIKQ